MMGYKPTVVETVFSYEGSPYETWDKFKEKLDDALAKVPPEFRDKVTVDIEAYEVYGDATANFKLEYQRPETLKEQKEREARFKEVAKRQYEQAKARLESLK